MTSQDIELVTSTWHQVVRNADTAAELFYTRLFETDPSTRALFGHADMPAQRRKLTQAISAVVSSLDRLNEILPVVEDLGRRHAGYGVNDAHYESVGAALIWTLEEGLGAAWSKEAAAGWTQAYFLLANAMRAAARTATQSGLGVAA
jgi:hemoglobin-like flavoprotein